MKIGIIDCGGANLNSIYYSFKRMNIKTHISNSLYELKKMDAFILPGVGTAGVVMNKLKENNLINLIQETTKPTLGICIGMQIFFDYSEEDNTNCLGIIEGSVKKLKPNKDIKVPQMGWNKVITNEIILVAIIILQIVITQIMMNMLLVIVITEKNLILLLKKIIF